MADTNRNWLDEVTSVFEPAPESIADSLLAQVFGNWIFAPEEIAARTAGGTTGIIDWTGLADVTIISSIMGYSGFFALILAVIITTYTFVVTMIKGAWTGEMSAEGSNSMWWLTRGAAAFSLIMPILTIGADDNQTEIATSQMWLMKLARAGSSGADHVSNIYIENLVSFPTSNPSQVNWIEGSDNMIKTAICVVSYAKNEPGTYADIYTVYEKKADVSTRPGGRTGRTNTNANIKETVRTRESLPAGTSASGTASQLRSIVNRLSAANVVNASRITFGKSGICGEVKFKGNLNNDITQLSGIGRLDAGVARAQYAPTVFLIKEAFQIAIELINDIKVINLIDKADSMEYTPAELALGIRYLTLAQTFNKEAYRAILGQWNTDKTFLSDALFGPIKAGGWAALGSTYILAPKVSNRPATALVAFHQSITYSDHEFNCEKSWLGRIFGGDDAPCDTLTDLSEGFKQLTLLGHTANEEFPQGYEKIECTVKSCDEKAIEDSIARKTQQAIVGMISSGAFANFSGLTDEKYKPTDISPLGELIMDEHPVTTLANIGTNFTHLKWMVEGLAVYVLTTKNATKDTVVAWIGAGSFGAAVAERLLEKIDNIIQQLSIAGFAMGYVIPKLPILIWVMMVAGWLITVIEGMFAVPFAVALLTTPEGDGAINTRFEKALSLIAAIFLRPFFAVIGFAASQAIAIPIFHFYNAMYWGYQDVYAIDEFMGITEIISGVMVYVIGAGLLVKMIFSVMHLLGDQMLGWMTSGVASAFGPQGIAEGVEGTVSSQADKVGTSSVAGGIASRQGKKDAELKRQVDEEKLKKLRN